MLGAWGNQRTPKAWGHPLSSLSLFPAPSQAGNVPGPRPAQPWCSPAPSVPAAGPSASAGASGSRPPRRGRPPVCAGCRIAAGERCQGKETVKIPQERERKVTAPFFLEMDEQPPVGRAGPGRLVAHPWCATTGCLTLTHPGPARAQRLGSATDQISLPLRLSQHRPRGKSLLGKESGQQHKAQQGRDSRGEGPS